MSNIFKMLLVSKFMLVVVVVVVVVIELVL